MAWHGMAWDGMGWDRCYRAKLTAVFCFVLKGLFNSKGGEGRGEMKVGF